MLKLVQQISHGNGNRSGWGVGFNANTFFKFYILLKYLQDETPRIVITIKRKLKHTSQQSEGTEENINENICTWTFLFEEICLEDLIWSFCFERVKLLLTSRNVFRTRQNSIPSLFRINYKIEGQSILTLKWLNLSSIFSYFNYFILSRDQQSIKEKKIIYSHILVLPLQKLGPLQKLFSWWLNPICTHNSQLYLKFP